MFVSAVFGAAIVPLASGYALFLGTFFICSRLSRERTQG
jgi:hypothetical protein